MWFDLCEDLDLRLSAQLMTKGLGSRTQVKRASLARDLDISGIDRLKLTQPHPTRDARVEAYLYNVLPLG